VHFGARVCAHSTYRSAPYFCLFSLTIARCFL
jgi:hypothetical protein